MQTLRAKMAMPGSQRYPQNGCLIEYFYISIFITLKTHYFQLCFLYKRDLRICAIKGEYQN